MVHSQLVYHQVDEQIVDERERTSTVIPMKLELADVVLLHRYDFERLLNVDVIH